MASIPAASVSPVRERRRAARRARLAVVVRAALAAGLILAFVLWAHVGSGRPVFSTRVSAEPGWDAFRIAYGVDGFGRDGYFVRAVQNGYNLVHHTHKYAWRFTRKGAHDHPNACIHCHSAEALAKSFATSDRFDPSLQRRVSFEERVMRCYADHLDGFVPTIYDPAVRDIRIFARMVAHHMQLGEGGTGAAP